MNAMRASSSTKSVSVVLCPGRHTAQRPAARDDALAVGEPDVGTDVLGAAAQIRPEALMVGDDVGRGRRDEP